jgi:hypothetical protein
MGRKKSSSNSNSKRLEIVDDMTTVAASDANTLDASAVATETRNDIPPNSAENQMLLDEPTHSNPEPATSPTTEKPLEAETQVMITHKDYNGNLEQVPASKYSLSLECKSCGEIRYYKAQDKFQVEPVGLCKACLGLKRRDKRNERLRDKYLKQKVEGAEGYDPTTPLKWNGTKNNK